MVRVPNKYSYIFLVVFSFAQVSHADVFHFTARENISLFNEANWDPVGLVIRPGIPVNHDLVISSRSIAVDRPDGDLELGTGSLTANNSSIDFLGFTGANGIEANKAESDPPNANVILGGGFSVRVEFLHDIDLIISSEGQGGIFIHGGLESLTRSTIDIRSGEVFIHLLGMNKDFFVNEYLNSVTVDGRRAVINENLGISTGPGDVLIFRIPEPDNRLMLLPTIAMLLFAHRHRFSAQQPRAFAD
jgi:hypothetical protein